jgi:pimeloyl-ACP methyl ester carboxylesterase
VRWVIAGSREPLSLTAVIARDYLDCGVLRALAAYRSSLSDPLQRELPRVHAPVLVLRGGRDRIVTQAWAEEVTSRLPNARLVVLPQAAHAINYAAPEAFVRAITPFLDEEPAQRPSSAQGVFR